MNENDLNCFSVEFIDPKYYFQRTTNLEKIKSLTSYRTNLIDDILNNRDFLLKDSIKTETGK